MAHAAFHFGPFATYAYDAPAYTLTGFSATTIDSMAALRFTLRLVGTTS